MKLVVREGLSEELTFEPRPKYEKKSVPQDGGKLLHAEGIQRVRCQGRSEFEMLKGPKGHQRGWRLIAGSHLVPEGSRRQIL